MSATRFTFYYAGVSLAVFRYCSTRWVQLPSLPSTEIPFVKISTPAKIQFTKFFLKQFRQKFFPGFSQNIFPANATNARFAIFRKCSIASFAKTHFTSYTFLALFGWTLGHHFRFFRKVLREKCTRKKIPEIVKMVSMVSNFQELILCPNFSGQPGQMIPFFRKVFVRIVQEKNYFPAIARLISRFKISLTTFPSTEPRTSAITTPMSGPSAAIFFW